MSERQEPIKPSVGANETGAKLAGRRGFLKKGALIATPVIVSVTSKPVWAGNCTLSGMLSGNLSQQTFVCQGGLPSVWANTTSWPAPYASGTYNPVTGLYENGTEFYAVFSSGVLGRPVYAPDSLMMNILRAYVQGDMAYELGAHAVAAVLNAASTSVDTFGYTPAQIVAMWNDPTLTNSELLANLILLNNR